MGAERRHDLPVLVLTGDSAERAEEIMRRRGVWEDEGRPCMCEKCALERALNDPPRDEFDPIPWFTEKDAQQALERMHAWASTADPLMRLVWDLLDDAQRSNLARVAMELRPR